jgi:superfamily II DNA or RNA helicase
MLKIIKLNESYIRLEGDADMMLNIGNFFSFEVEGAKWNPKVKAGIWDGRIRMLERGNKLPIGLYSRLIQYCKDFNIEYEKEGFKNLGMSITNQNIIDFYNSKVGFVYNLHDFQVDLIRDSFKQMKLIGILPTSAGKSLVQFLVTMIHLALNPNNKVLMIVPTVTLVHQMNDDFCEYINSKDNNFQNKIHCIYSGKEKSSNKRIVISTWQSLMNLPPSAFKEYTCILCDEVHSAEKGVVLQSIMKNCINAKMKLGVSGSLTDAKVNLVQLEGNFGSIKKYVTTKELMKRGIVSALKIKVMILKYNKDDRRLAHGMEYPTEMQFLREHKPRLDYICNITEKINKNVMILFRNIDYGRAIYDQLVAKDLGRDIYFIYGNTKAEIREEAKRLTKLSKDNIIVASGQIFATGVNIPSLDVVLFGQTQKSKIKVVQAIGRVLRKTKTKRNALLIDIVDDLVWKRKQNYSMKHALKRLEIYDSEEFDYDIKEIEL